jgi:hypothetical protein
MISMIFDPISIWYDCILTLAIYNKAKEERTNRNLSFYCGGEWVGWFSDSNTIWFLGGVGWRHSLLVYWDKAYGVTSDWMGFIGVFGMTIMDIAEKGYADHDQPKMKRRPAVQT